jgi:hypothetical protein
MRSSGRPDNGLLVRSRAEGKVLSARLARVGNGNKCRDRHNDRVPCDEGSSTGIAHEQSANDRCNRSP